MRFIPTSVVTLSLLFTGSVRAATYNVVDTFQGSSFFSGFSFFSQADPTHGRVNYVSQADAQNLGLATVSGSNFILRADSTTTLSASGPGRNSFRIISNKQYSTHVSVFNVQHMPQGCGTWPAIWELGDNWPNGGEVDIVEGVNDQMPNLSSLHTSPGCTMPASRAEIGNPTGLDCNAFANSNAGCGVQTTAANSYGPAFNNNGGGWYALERTPSFVKIWYWPRGAGNVPSDVSNGGGSINTDAWGTPTAYFPNTQCDISSKFTPSNIIINLTFCESSAETGLARSMETSGCPGTCVDFVNNNPGAFANAYFNFNWVKVYQ
ncbi:endo-beta-glucanase [Lactarius deliciosus]|nr:endo-beta-glucanase [Lactarius deliciosus]